MSSIRTRGPSGLLFLAAFALAVVAVPFGGPAFAEDAPATEPSADETAEVPWVRDFEKAKATARAEKKDLLINFTGSDWCGWCHKLEGEVFGKKAFLDEAVKKYVFVFLDFPNAAELKAKVVDPELNQKLKTEYAVAGYPTIMLTNADGVPYARTGYQAGGPAPYLESLAKFRDESAPLTTLVKAGGASATLEQVQAGFKVLAAQNLLSYPGYAWILDKARAFDKDGSLGMRDELDRIDEERKFMALIRVPEGQEPNWDKIHELLLASKYLKGGTFLNVGFHVANKLLEDDKPTEAKALAEKLAKDPIFKENAGAKAKIDGFIAQCEAAEKGEAEEGDEEGDDEGGEDDDGGK